MSSTFASPIPFEAWQPFAGSLGEIRDSHEALGTLAEQMFDELDERRRELEAREARLHHDVEEFARKAADLAQQRDQWLAEISQNHDRIQNQPAAGELQQTIAGDQQQLDTLTSDLVQSQADLSDARCSLQNCQAELAATCAELAECRAALEVANDQRAEFRSGLEKSQNELASLRTELTMTAARLSEQCATAIEQTKTEQLLREQLHDLQLERQRTELRLEQATAQLAMAADESTASGDLRGQLLAAQNDYAALRAELTSTAARLTEQCAETVARTQAEQQLREQLHELQLERQRIELRLEQAQADLTQAADENGANDALRNQLTSAHNELSAVRAELTATAARLAEQCSETVLHSKSEQQLRQQLHELQLAGQRDAIALEQAQAALAAAADQNQGRSELQAELSATQAELTALREQLSAAGGPAEALRAQLKDAELERRSLEMELESVRERAVELSDSLAAQKRQAAEDRTHWSGELKEMRRLLERQSELIGTRDARAPAASINPTSANTSGAVAPSQRPQPRPAAPPAKPAAKPDDAVLGSVMAQFENLQKDRLRRKSTPGS